MRIHLSATATLCALAGLSSAQTTTPAPQDSPGSTVVAGAWTLATETADVVVFVKPAGPAPGPEGYRRMPVRYEFAIPQASRGSAAFQSMEVVFEFDCAQNRVRTDQGVAFSGHNLVGSLGPPQAGHSDWSRVPDRSLASVLKKLACPA